MMNNCNNGDLICGGDLCDRGCENEGFTIFGTGFFFPPIPQRSFSFYSARGATVSSGGALPLFLHSGTPLPVTADGVTLPAGNNYISYSFQCTTENNVAYVEVVPHLNGAAIIPGSFKAVRTPSGLHSQASGALILASDGAAELSFRAVTDEGVSIGGISFDLLIIHAF